jgi:hypothetical protein
MITTLQPGFVTAFPNPMTPGELYISTTYNTCGHLCARGCGTEVITPLSPAGWSITYDGHGIWMRPSVGTGRPECGSHYWIVNNHIRWAAPMSARHSSAARASDTKALNRHIRATRRRWWQRLLHPSATQRR